MTCFGRRTGFAFLVLLFVFRPSHATEGPQRVLILHSFGRDFAPFNEVAQQFRTELALRSPEPVEFVDASLALARFDDLERDAPLLNFISAIYAVEPPDLLVPVGGPALQFCLRNRAVLFPQTPVLVLCVDQRRLADLPPDEKIVSVSIDVDLPVLMKNMFDLLPETRHVYVAMGAAPLEQFWEAEMRREWKGFTDRAEFHWWSALSVEQMKQHAAGLPPSSVIFSGIVARDAAGVPYEQERALAELHAVANAPIFGYAKEQLGLGIVGGPVLGLRQAGTVGVDAALRLLAGEPPRDIRVLPQSLLPPVYDWRELKRWKIPESRLPQSSTVLFREPTLWEEYRWVIAAVVALCLLESGLILALLIEYRRRRIAERNARESEEQMQLAAEAANIGMWSLDLRRKGIWASERARKLYGFTKSEPIDFEKFLERVHSDDRGPVKAATQVLMRDGGQYREEYRVVLPSGEQRRILAMGSSVEAADGTPKQLRGVSLDVTNRRLAEVKLEQLSAQLAHATRVSTLGELASTLAHELNQPLTAMLSNAQAALRMEATGALDSQDVHEILEDIVRDDKRAGEIIHRMRTFLEKEVHVHEPVDLRQSIHDAAGLLRGRLLEAGIALKLDLPSELPLVEAGVVEVQQVVLNLMLNGIEAMSGTDPSGRKLIVTAKSENGRVIVCIQDRGPGVAAEMIENVFQPFYSSKPGGLGLGLAICRRIAETHDGQLWLESNTDRGAAFCFALPVAAGKP